jgi:YD repeat-containing protein
MSGAETSFDVFFSYHWRDHTLVEGVARTLTTRGLRVFLDRWYLTPGQPWPQALERTLASCNSVAVFLGSDGLGPWQQRERDLALDRQGREPGFPVIPVLLKRADPALGFLKLNTWVDLSANVSDEAALEILCAAIRGQPPAAAGLQQIAAVRAEICPYRGLRSFREEDAAFFCGREAFTGKLVEAVERTSLVAVVGASGIGKSSVVRAGLIPRLRETKASRVWEIATLVPTDRPLHSLAAALVPILAPEMTSVDRLAEINKLAEHLAEGAVALRDVAAEVLRTQPGTDRLLLVVDQWEELYTLTADDDARRRFLAEILDATAKGPVTVVLTLRGDFFGQALSDRSFADRLQGAQVNLGPMTQDELERSITEPAAKAGLQFEPGLVDRILADVGQEPGSLPLLEFVLAALWEQRQGITLHHDAYERMGGAQGAIAARADAEFEKLDAAQKDAARHMLIQMVRPGEETEDTRQRAVLPAGNVAALTVIRRLADARLIVTARDAASGAETVEVTHEALIRHWSLLREWIDQDREFLRSKVRLEAAAVLWEGEKRDASRLLPAGRPLAEGEKMLASRRSDLSGSVIAFIEASAAATARMRGRTLLWKAAALAAVVLVLAGGILYWDLNFRTHEQYYNAYAKRWGVFEGVGPVRADDVEYRSRTFRFVKKGRLGPVARVDAIDGSGGCAARSFPDPTGMDFAEVQDDPRRPCHVLWDYDSKGRVSRHTLLDGTDRAIVTLVYTDAEGRTAEFRTEEGHLAQLGSVATTVTFDRIGDGPNIGLDRSERYTDSSGEPKPFLVGASAARMEYGPDGLVARVVLLGLDSKPMRVSAGFAEVRIRHDEAGNPIEYSFFDENAKPVLIGDGTSRLTLTYDAHGNPVREDYFDETGRPTRNKDGYAALARTYGDGGKEIERAYFDEVDKPTLSKNGYSRIARNLDSKGRPTKEAYFDEAGKPTLSTEGYAAVTTRYDKSGNVVEEGYFDQAGKPTRHKDGYAKITFVYDDRGRPVEVAYFDAAGMPTLSKDGYAKRGLSYDSGWNANEEIYFDEAGKITLSSDGYAKVTKHYDGVGQIVEEAYLDELGKPTLSKEGYAKIVNTYDGQGKRVKTAYFDAAGKPTFTKSGYASVKFVRDAQLRVLRESYYDKNGNPVRSKNGNAIVTQAFDERGNLVESANFDEAGKPTLHKEGWAKVIKAYDTHGNEVRLAFFDEAGKPTVTKEGIASAAVDYDTRGNAVRRLFYDESGKRSLSKYNYAGLSRTYDTRDRVVEEAYFDAEGKPTAYRGYKKINLVYDAHGNQIENRYSDETSMPVRSDDGYARLTQAFDHRGNLIEQEYFDEAGKPTRSKDKYARVVKTYDHRANLIETTFLDEVGKPTRGSDGYARETNTYDSRGNLVASAYFDEAGKPTRSKGTIAGFTQTFDARGNIIEAHALDEEGQLTRAKDGSAIMIIDYDARDNRIAEAYYDVHRNPIQVTNGYARKTLAFDARGNPIEEAYFDEKGDPIQAKNGYAKMTKAYDSRDHEIEAAYFNAQGHPTSSKDGYARVAKVCDARGNVVEAAYFDEQGRPTVSKDGFALVRRIYNSGREATKETYFNEKGIEIPAPRGAAASSATKATP